MGGVRTRAPRGGRPDAEPSDSGSDREQQLQQEEQQEQQQGTRRAAKRAKLDGPVNPFVREGELQALTQNMEADFTVQLAKQTKQGSPK